MKLADLDVVGRRSATRRRASESTPWMRRTFDSIPSICAPSETRKRQRSWTCGSQAALPITVSPGVSTAAMTVFSVAITLASSRKMCSPRRPPSAPHLVDASPELDLCAQPREARGCAGRAGAARSRRRPAAGRSRARARTSSGPASRNDARMRAHSIGSSSCLDTSAAWTRTSFGPVHATSAPTSSSSSSIVSHVADPRHVRERHRLARQQRRGEDRQRAVLVAGRLDASRQRRRPPSITKASISSVAERPRQRSR